MMGSSKLAFFTSHQQLRRGARAIGLSAAIAVATMASLGHITPGHAEDAKSKASPDWRTAVSESQTAAEYKLDARGMALIAKINAYFNAMRDFQGRFVQTNPDNKVMKGRFFVKRPGLMRFDYASPSRVRIVSDGKYLAIEDHDLKTVDRYPLDSTPFGILLADDVNILRDARLIELQEGKDYVMITIQDKSDKMGGHIKLFFAKADMALKEWIITDPQGLNTKIQVASLTTGTEHKRAFFKIRDLDLEEIIK